MDVNSSKGRKDRSRQARLIVKLLIIAVCSFVLASVIQWVGVLLPALSTADVSTIINDNYYNSNPSIVVDPLGRIHVFYRQGTSNTAGLKYQRAVSADNGANWTISTITSPPAGSGYHPQNSFALLTNQGRMYLAATMYNPGGVPSQESWLSYSDNYGTTWSSWTKIPDSMFYLGTSASFAVVSDMIDGKNGELLLSMYGYLSSRDIYFSSVLYRSVDRGATWTTSTIASAPSRRTYDEAKLLYIAGGKLAAWVRDENGGGTAGKLWETESNDDGTSWGSVMDVTPPGYMRSYPNVSIAGKTTQLFYRGTRGGGNTKRAVSYDFGKTWQADEVINSGLYEYSRSILADNTVMTVLAYTNGPGFTGKRCKVVLRTDRIEQPSNLDSGSKRVRPVAMTKAEPALLALSGAPSLMSSGQFTPHSQMLNR